jgi:hypothetical protein
VNERENKTCKLTQGSRKNTKKLVTISLDVALGVAVRGARIQQTM